MRTHQALSASRATGDSGCDYLTTGTLAYATQWPLSKNTGYYGFYVATAATVTAVVFKDLTGDTLTLSPTWLNVSLPAGCWIPAGFITGEDAYISSITLSGGAIILYLD